MNQLLGIIQTVKNTWEYTFSKKTSDISAFIDLMLREKNMTRTKFADELGVSRSCVTHMLNGDTNFTIKTIAKIAMILDSSFEEIVSYERPKRRPEPFVYQTAGSHMMNPDYRKEQPLDKKDANIDYLAA